MTVYPLQANMTRGEATPYVHARGDTEHYSASVAEARNVFVLRYGGLARVPGTIYNGAAKNADRAARFIKFQFKRSQVYAIEAGHLYFRFWTTLGRIEVASVPVEVVTPYDEADLRYMRVRQSGDVIYIWCAKVAGGAYQPMKLTRASETSWSLSEWEPKGGPFLREETGGATLTPASHASLTPTMSGLTAPSGTVTSSGAVADAWEVFDKNIETKSVLDSGGTGYVQYRLAGSAKMVVDAMAITAARNNTENYDMPSIFQLRGSNDGSTWVTLTSIKGQTGWQNSETRHFEFPNSTAYEYHRLDFQGGGGDDGSQSDIGELAVHQKDTDQTPWNLTLSDATAVNDSAGFLASDVGRVIRLLGSDGLWRNATIKGYISSTVVTVVTDGHAFPNLNPISRWQMGAFSDYSGWPKTGAIYEDRLTHASTEADPLGLWMSRSADYDDFSVSDPLVADDAVSLRLTGGGLDEISWLSEGSEDVVAGTAGALRAVGRNSPNEAFGPANARQKAQTLTPSSTAEPVSIENVLVFLDFYEQRLYEAAYTYEVDGYLAREASTLNEHLFAAGVAQIAYLSHPHKIIVGRRYDGKLIFFTYDREQKVAGGTLVDIGGTVESIMDLPGDTGTDLWMIVKRTVNGGDVRYIERLAEFWRSEYTVQDVPVYAAAAAIYDGAPVNTILTADHLKGATVGVWADGRDMGDAVVDSNGDFTIPGGITASQVVYGLRMPWRIKTLRLTQIGNQDGSGLGRSVKIVEGAVDVHESAGIHLGSVDVQDLVTFESEIEEDPDAAVPLRTGMFSIPVDDTWQGNGVLVVEGDRMYPATIRAIQLQVDGEP